MTGLVFFAGHDVQPLDAYSLEFSYVLPSLLITDRIFGVLQYNWSYVDDILNRIAARKHQAIIRFRYGKFLKGSFPLNLKKLFGFCNCKKKFS